jgi:heterodisulfide reductase subunit B2
VSYVFFPGCSLEGTAKDFHASTRAVATALGLDMPELENWTCCGSTPAHQTDALLAIALPAKNLIAAQGKTVAVCCAACYGRLKTANHEISHDAEMKKKVADVVGTDYAGKTPVSHLLEILARDVGVDTIAAAVKAPLTGLKVATYYGCLLSRPSDVTAFDDPENPTLMDDVLRAAGATVVDWPHKTECCGAGHGITDTGLVKTLSREILAMAKTAGADCIATACPLCQMNLDLRQADIERATGEHFGLPILYFTQLLGIALSLPSQALGLGSLVVDPTPLLPQKGMTAT